jgi:hypothetical protein
MTVSEGYQDGLAGRNATSDDDEYRTGWELGWRQRVLAWNETCNPIFGVQHSHPNKGQYNATQ